MSIQKNKKTVSARNGGKREEVLHVACENFLANGYDGTSINVMTRNAGISKESVYRYFESKEALFLAVVERELLVYQERMQETVSDYFDRPLEEALCHLAESALSAVMSDRTMALRRLVFQRAVTEPKVGAYYFEAGPKIAYQNIRNILEHHLKSSTLKTAVDVDRLSKYFVSMVLHTLTLEKECALRKRYSVKEIHQYCQLVVNDFLNAYFVK